MNIHGQVVNAATMTNKRKYADDHNSSERLPNTNGNSASQADLSRVVSGTIPVLPSISEEYERPVFTHPSVTSHEQSSAQMINYDRLEFLGDAYLETIATRAIWETYKNLSAGKMAQTRQELIKNETLCKFSTLYGFDKKLKLARDEKLSHVSVRTKINADVFEAYIAAIILSDPINGFGAAEQWLNQLWEPMLKQFDAKPTEVKSKEELAKKILAPGIKINYIDEAPRLVQKGKGIETYFIGVYVTGWGWENQHLGSGTGLSKSAAGMAAATNALRNRPLIDEIAAKKKGYYEKREKTRKARKIQRTEIDVYVTQLKKLFHFFVYRRSSPQLLKENSR